MKPTDGYVYSLNGVTWQQSNVFTGLKASTQYHFYQMVPESETTIASQVSPALTVKTPDKIANTVYMGMVVRTDTPMIPGTWMYNDSITIDHSIETAKALLAADGWYDSNDDGILDKLDSKGEEMALSIRLKREDIFDAMHRV